MTLVSSTDLRWKVARTLSACAAIVPVLILASASCSSSDDSAGPPGIDSGTAYPDAAISSDAIAGSCAPGDVSSFTGGDYHPPLGASQGKCDDDFLEEYIDCKQNANPVACNMFATGDGAACLACLETKQTDANWGPIVYDTSGTDGTPNVAGCVALALGEGQSTTGCGASLQQAENCQDLACGANCASSGDASVSDLTDLATCENNALLAGCKTFANAKTVACAQDAGGADAICYRQTYEDGGASEDVWSYIARLDKFFCGDPTVDAGSTGDGG